MNKVKNCKSIGERKKDKTDPIVNPTYFMRDTNNAESVTIEHYKQKVLKMNRPVSAHPTKSNQFTHTMQMQSNQYTDDFSQGPTSFGNVPNYSKNRPSSAQVPQNKNHMK